MMATTDQGRCQREGRKVEYRRKMWRRRFGKWYWWEGLVAGLQTQSRSTEREI